MKFISQLCEMLIFWTSQPKYVWLFGQVGLPCLTKPHHISYKIFASASENTFNFHQLYLTLKPGIVQKFFWKIRKVLENQSTWIVLNQQTIVYSIIVKALFKRQKVPKIQKAYLNFLLLKQFALFLQHSQFNST